MTWQIVESDCVEAMRAMPAGSVDAVVCDPPYNLTFMGKPWDCHDGQEDAGFAYWLSGLIDGEGHFAIKAHARGSHAPAFTLKMRADEEGTLRLVERTLRIGSLTSERRDGNPMVRWTVQDKTGCQRLVDLLDKYPLRAKKRIDYLAWREAVCEWTSRGRGNRWHGAVSNVRMAALREQVMERRGYVEPAWSGNDFQDWCRVWGCEALRVLKPGGHLLAMGGTRTHHRLMAGLEDAGFEIRDTLAYMYGSGFPKSLDVGKAIDKAAGAEREPDKYTGANGLNAVYGDNMGGGHTLARGAPATPDAERWQGWGTALKPAHEPIVLARKPLAGTVAGNVLAHGTGALNVDGCRIESGERPARSNESSASGLTGTGGASTYGSFAVRGSRAVGETTDGRWPANVVLDPEAAAILDEQTGTLHSQDPATRNGGRKPGWSPSGTDRPMLEKSNPNGGDSGGASRFFYVAKASSAERNAGLDGFEAAEYTYSTTTKRCRVCGCTSVNGHAKDQGVPSMGCGHPDAEIERVPYAVSDGKARNSHPTVKPVNLMRWLVRLVTPPGGTVLDPFAGSGSTGCAAVLEGFDFTGIDREPEYVAIARARIAWWSEHPDGMALVERLEAERTRQAVKDSGQLDIFGELTGSP